MRQFSTKALTVDRLEKESMILFENVRLQVCETIRKVSPASVSLSKLIIKLSALSKNELPW